MEIEPSLFVKKKKKKQVFGQSYWEPDLSWRGDRRKLQKFYDEIYIYIASKRD